MVCVNDRRRIFQFPLPVHIQKTDKIFIMIVWDTCPVFIYASAQYDMCQIISLCRHIHSPVYKRMRTLCCHYRIEHYRKISACRIFHSYRYIHRTCRQTMLLIFHRSCSDCLIRQNIVKITSIFGIEHLICPGKSALLNRSYMHLSDRYDSG